MSSPSGKIIQLMRLHESFFTGTIAILGLQTAAFTPLLKYPVLSPPLQSFMLSTYCVTMMLCITALCADVSLCSAGFNFHARHWSGILRTITILTGLLAVISLLSISKPYIASVSLLMWLILAIHLILSLYRDLTQPILPITINKTSNSISVVFNSVNAVVGVMKIWAANLFHL